MKVLILGCGNVGSETALQLMERHQQDIEMVLGDRNLDAAEALAQQIGPKARAIQVDVTDAASLRTALQGMQLVFPAWVLIVSIVILVTSARTPDHRLEGSYI